MSKLECHICHDGKVCECTNTDRPIITNLCNSNTKIVETARGEDEERFPVINFEFVETGSPMEEDMQEERDSAACGECGRPLYGAIEWCELCGRGDE